ncbi:MAG TPA: ribbon-helix-helix domain-containing protein [Streptosporangiaceae bacterium]
MKTAISLSDATFERVTSKARELGISRSAFFARAVELYLDDLAGHSVTEHVNEALRVAGGDESWPAAAAAARDRLAAGDDW